MHRIFKIFLFFNKYKMFKNNAETYLKNCIHTIILIKKDYKSVLWIKMYDLQVKFGVINMSGLTIKTIKGIYNNTNLTKNELKNTKDM